MPEQLYILPILLFSVVIHEISHGWMALRLGDTTARDLGRLTLNPVPHIDLVGSILVPLFSLAVAGRVFIAWAKPVPVNPLNFTHYRRDDILVSIVGPLSNIVLAWICTGIFIVLLKVDSTVAYGHGLAEQAIHFLMSMFYGGITLNIVLAVFNMIPVPPLDGSHVVASLLPHGLSQRYRSLGFFGIFIILMLMRWQPFAVFFGTVIEVLEFPFQMVIHAFV
ncbi:MAG: site-2 protease family protein [Ignavibacteria bacterium]|nr:site-2 protease family protein [Ignavibacteria bacterium]